MTAAELIAFLQTVPPDSVVVVNGEIIVSAIMCRGRINGDLFRRSDKGNKHAVMFLHHTELSDGQWVLAAI